MTKYVYGMEQRGKGVVEERTREHRNNIRGGRYKEHDRLIEISLNRACEANAETTRRNKGNRQQVRPTLAHVAAAQRVPKHPPLRRLSHKVPERGPLREHVVPERHGRLS